MYYGLFIGTTLLQLGLLNLYFSVLFNTPNVSKKTIYISYLLAGGIQFASSVFFYPVIVTGVLSISSAYLIARLYPVRLESRLIFSNLFLILGLIAESLSCFLIRRFGVIPEADNLSELGTHALILLLSNFIMLFFSQVIRFIKRGHDYKIHNGHYFVIILIILISLFILNTMLFYMEKNLYYILSVIGILFINLLIVFLFDRMIERFRLADENHQLQKQMVEQDNTYETTLHSFKNIKRIIHDTNKQLVYIRTCIRENEYEEAIRHINKTLDKINTSYQRVTTGSLVIDALVSNALNCANDNRITMKHDIHVADADIRVDRYDLCIVIGNVLDNAIEAARLVPEIEDKSIHLKISSNNHILSIHVVNSRPVSPNQERALKENPAFHGIGLSNIQKVAEKYGGYMRTETKDKQFETTVLLPFQE